MDGKRKPAIKKCDIENEHFSELTMFVSKKYNNNSPLNSHQSSKLQKMKTSVYTYAVILKTFDDYSRDIEKSLWGKSFRSDNDRFDYICAIVKNNLNTVYNRMRMTEKAREEVEMMDFSILTHEGAAYQKKTEKTSNRLKDLW